MKFLAKSLQESSAGGGKRGKVGLQMVPKSIQNGASLAQGVGKGYPKINRNMKNYKKRKRKHTNEKKTYISLCAAISLKNLGLNGLAFTDFSEKRK